MIKEMLLLSVTLIACGCSTMVDNNRTVPNPLSKRIGADSHEILMDFSSIAAYRLGSPMRPGELKIGIYPVMETKKELNAQIQEDLRELLLNSDNYDFTSIKRCVFIPQTAFELVHNNQTLTILVSMVCNQVEFQYQGQIIRLDIDKSSEKFSELIIKIFN